VGFASNAVKQCEAATVHVGRETVGFASNAVKQCEAATVQVVAATAAAAKDTVVNSAAVNTITATVAAAGDAVKTKKTNLTDITSIALKAYVEEVKRSVRWRSQREQNCRKALAWLFNAAIFFLAALVVLVYGVKALGSEVMTATVVSWCVAIMQVFLIIEPVQVFIIVLCPFFFSEQTAIGRCFRRVQWCYNEYFTP